ncbi:MAG: transthyretin-like family protein [Desulfobacteria bacterium]
MGTDKPIEGAGVLAVYDMTVYYWIERNSEYVGYQAVLTDKEGKFEVPAKFFFAIRPLASFDPKVEITIYKRGYGNFPGSTNPRRPKHVTTDPPIGTYLPPDKEIIFRLPKLETEEERKEHDLLITGTGIPDSDLPPRGMTLEQFEKLYGRF